MGQERRWSDAEPFYAYPSRAGIVKHTGWTVPADEWVEVTMRMLDRGDFSDDELDAMHSTLREATHIDLDVEEVAAGPEEVLDGD